MMEPIQAVLASYTKDDVDEAQYREFYNWCYSLQYDIQTLYDDVLIRNDTRQRRAILDASYISMESVIQQAKLMLKGGEQG